MKATILNNRGKKKKIDFLKDPMILKILKEGGEIVIPDDRNDIYEFILSFQRVNPNIKIIKSKNVIRDYTKDLNTLNIK